MANDLTFVVRVTELLRVAGVHVWLFGGWTEEMLRLAAPRPHDDVDFLYPCSNFDVLDELIRRVPLDEILGKHFAHKRAFTLDGVMVEITLARHDARGYHTSFWGERCDWPPDTFDDESRPVPAVSEASLAYYRTNHALFSYDRHYA